MTVRQAMVTSFEEARMLMRGKDAEMRENWELARWMMFIVVSGNPYIRQGRRPRRPSDLIRFPWEDAVETKGHRPVSEDERKGLDDIMRVFYKMKGRN